MEMRALIATIAAVALQSGPVLAGPSCGDASLQQAIAARHVQTQMMVGAVQCRGARKAGQSLNYDIFLQRFGRNLEAEHAILVEGFQRTHGATYKQQMDSYITNLANSVSLQLLRNDNFCGEIEEFGAVLNSRTDIDWSVLRGRLPLAITGADDMVCSSSTLAQRSADQE